MPYITEELWLSLPGANESLMHPAYTGAGATIMLTGYPEGQSAGIDEKAEWEMQAVIDLISRVRNIRSEMNIKASERVPILIGAADEKLRAVYAASADQIARLVRASEVSVNEQLGAPRASARAVLGGGAEVAVPLEGLIDFEQERQRLGRELEKLQVEGSRLETQLGNPQVRNALRGKGHELRQRLADIGQRTVALTLTLEALT